MKNRMQIFHHPVNPTPPQQTEKPPTVLKDAPPIIKKHWPAPKT